MGFFCSLLAPSDAILFQEGVSVKLRLPHSCRSANPSLRQQNCEEIIKLIYLRRYFEIVDERGDAYQLLSNLFHRRVAPLDYREPAAAGSGYPKMAPEKIQQALRDIREYVDSFDYPRLQALVSSPDEIKKPVPSLS